ncbi:MAG: type II toxin-antitoxin system HicA family toxin [Pyrinomonadaceae bacterium]
MSRKFPSVNGLQLIRVLEKSGFVRKRQKGSHVHLFRETDKRRVTVPVHKGKDIPVGTLRAILKDADLSAEEFIKLI